MNADTFSSLLANVADEDMINLNIALKHIENAMVSAEVSQPMADIFITKLVSLNIEAFRNCRARATQP
jgi:hypothetical protein